MDKNEMDVFDQYNLRRRDEMTEEEFEQLRKDAEEAKQRLEIKKVEPIPA